jgi:hypothetical protein
MSVVEPVAGKCQGKTVLKCCTTNAVSWNYYTVMISYWNLGRKLTVATITLNLDKTSKVDQRLQTAKSIGQGSAIFGQRLFFFTKFELAHYDSWLISPEIKLMLSRIKSVSNDFGERHHSHKCEQQVGEGKKMYRYANMLFPEERKTWVYP